MKNLFIASILAAVAADSNHPTEEEILNVIKSVAVHIDPYYGIVVTRFGEESQLYPVSRLKRYDYNNGTISFTDESGQWCLPSINIAGHDICFALEKLGYKKGLYVPFSNGDEPKDFMEHWKLLRDIQRQQHEEYKQQKFSEYCEEHGIKEIPEDILRNYAMEILPQGMKAVRLEEDFGNVEAKCVTEAYNIEFLGTFHMNNGVIIIVDTKGRTAVAPCSDEHINPGFLRSFGFRDAELYVPFSNGDLPADQYVADRWTSLCRSSRKTA